MSDTSGWCPSSSATAASLLRKSMPACAAASVNWWRRTQGGLQAIYTMKFFAANVREIDFLSGLRAHEGQIWDLYWRNGKKKHQSTDTNILYIIWIPVRRTCVICSSDRRFGFPPQLAHGTHFCVANDLSCELFILKSQLIMINQLIIISAW